MAEPENFAGHPRSVTEIRSDKSQNAADWSPRDVLINLLRQIDEGKADPTALVVAWGNIEGDTVDTHYAASSPNGLVTLGVVARVMHRLNRNMSGDV